MNSNMPGSATFMLTQLDDEIKKASNEEYLLAQAKTVSGMVKDEVDLEFQVNQDRIARLKTICNKLDMIRKEKRRLIVDLKSQIALRSDCDAQLLSEVSNSELLINALSTRNITMEDSLAEVKRINDGYNELLKMLVRNPPYLESHVQV